MWRTDPRGAGAEADSGDHRGLVDEELKGALGAAPSQRVGAVRAGYRHGKRQRTLTTSLGATEARQEVAGAATVPNRPHMNDADNGD